MARRSAASSGEIDMCLLMAGPPIGRRRYRLRPKNSSSLQDGPARTDSSPLFENGLGLEKGLDPVLTVFAADAGKFEAAPRCLRIVGHRVDHDPACPQLRSHAACAL